MNDIMKAVIDILGTDIGQLPLFVSRKSKQKPAVPEIKHLSSGIVAASTHHGPKRTNEDRVLSGSSWGLNYILVADGLGGYPHGGDASQIAVNTFQREIKDIIQKNRFVQYERIKRLYQKAAKEINRVAHNTKGWKTTMLCIIEGPGDFLISYLGDGQIYLVRGDAEIAVPLMIGHRVNGLLGGVLGPELTAEPVVMQLSKSFKSGEIFVAGTDGVFNSEIQKAKPNLLMELIAGFKKSLKIEKPAKILFHFLDQLNTQNLLHDNASLGLMVTEKARQYLFRGGEHERRN